MATADGSVWTVGWNKKRTRYHRNWPGELDSVTGKQSRSKKYDDGLKNILKPPPKKHIPLSLVSSYSHLHGAN